MERQDRERRKEEERLMRERQREEERSKKEQKRENERREKFLQKENIRVSLGSANVAICFIVEKIHCNIAFFLFPYSLPYLSCVRLCRLRKGGKGKNSGKRERK